MYIKREVKPLVDLLLKEYPVISICGPRQCGKSTFLQHEYKDFKYITLDDSDTTTIVKSDIRGFLEENEKLIIDEIQYIPELFRYIKSKVDKEGKNGQYILSSSQNLLLNNKITESLAGRVGIVEMSPLSLRELDKIDKKLSNYDLEVKGFYPRIYSHNVNTTRYFSNYIKTYIERDVSGLNSVHNLDNFVKLLSFLANGVGSPLNLTNISNNIGVSQNTVKNWISILKSSYIVFEIPKFTKLFNKRFTKAPKLYFNDTGLLAHLLGIQNKEQLLENRINGVLFENMVISEMKKAWNLESKQTFTSYYNENNGKNGKLDKEIDIIIEQQNNTNLFEIKASKTANIDFSTFMAKIADELKIDRSNCKVIYNYETNTKLNNIDYVYFKDYFRNLTITFD